MHAPSPTDHTNDPARRHGYAIARVRSLRPGPAITAYLQRIDATLAAFGGRYLVHGGPVQVLEGAWEGDTIVLEFPDVRAARAWYDSPEYGAIKVLRTSHAECDVVIVAGVGVDHRATDVLAGMPAAPSVQPAQGAQAAQAAQAATLATRELS